MAAIVEFFVTPKVRNLARIHLGSVVLMCSHNINRKKKNIIVKITQKT